MLAKALRFTLILGLLSLAACKDEIYRGLSARDANEMTALLIAQGISATRESKEDGTYRLMVDGSEFGRSIAVLSANGYPRESYRSLGEIFPGDGLIVSPLEQRARLNFALNQELSRTVSMIDGVVRARVHVVVPEYDFRTGTPPKPTASVAVHHIPTLDPLDLTAKVRLLVANGVQGLSFRDVSVATFIAAGSSAQTPTAKTPGFSLGHIEPPALSWSALLWVLSALAALGALLYILRTQRQKA